MVSIVRRTLYDCRYLLRRSRKRNSRGGDGDIQVIGSHIRGLVEEIASKYDTAAPSQSVLETGLQVITGACDGYRGSTCSEQNGPDGHHWKHATLFTTEDECDLELIGRNML